MVSSVAVWLWHWRSVVQLARAFFLIIIFWGGGDTIVRVS